MPLRIHLHDNSGHPFTIQLSRALAARGHQVLHTYMATFQSPKGQLEVAPGDAPTLRIEGIDLGGSFAKYSYWQRWQQERRYGAALARRLEEERPEVLLACNTPPEMLEIVQRCCKRLGIRFVFWVQDLYGPAIRQILGGRYWGAGRLIAAHYERKEARLLRRSDQAVAITEDFRSFLREAGLPDDRISVIGNWAPIEELPTRPRHNAWSRAQGLDEAFVFLYSGTLGLKHDPALLVMLAEAFRDDPQVLIAVVTEGIGADWLRQACAEKGLHNLRLLPFQPFEQMPEVLASADVLVAMLEEGAGVFSVPSKILSYQCAGRPVLLSAPGENQATKMIVAADSGRVCPSADRQRFVDEARRLMADSQLRLQLGRNGRQFAESRFQIEAITGHFETILRKAVA
ncbi:MAG TPA: glycosyltransferase family 4 protein [Solimonas sp.]|nr:glycosyltransferase family 4 protein [Solimonas sp.]